MCACLSEGMDLQREIELLKKQLEERRRADDAEKARLRLNLEEARAEIKADETYFDRLGRYLGHPNLEQ